MTRADTQAFDQLAELIRPYSAEDSTSRTDLAQRLERYAQANPFVENRIRPLIQRVEAGQGCAVPYHERQEILTLFLFVHSVSRKNRKRIRLRLIGISHDHELGLITAEYQVAIDKDRYEVRACVSALALIDGSSPELDEPDFNKAREHAGRLGVDLVEEMQEPLKNYIDKHGLMRMIREVWKRT